jgi:NAD(P)H-nitrite reductase large subunit
VSEDAEIVMFEVVKLIPSKQKTQICNLNSNKEYWQTYDDLVISTSAIPLKPPISEIDQEGVFSVRGITDVEALG